MLTVFTVAQCVPVRERLSGGNASVLNFCARVRLLSDAQFYEAYKVLSHMVYLFTKGYGIIFLGLFRTCSQGRAGTTSMGVKA